MCTSPLPHLLCRDSQGRAIATQSMSLRALRSFSRTASACILRHDEAEWPVLTSSHALALMLTIVCAGEGLWHQEGH